MTRRKLKCFLVSFVCVALFELPPVPVLATGAAGDNTPRPRIGLALSGGGARGAAHIGVLSVLEKHHIPVDYIAGTSMGAIVGALYASGMSPSELEELVSQTDWANAFIDRIPRKDRSFRRKRDDDLYLVKHKPGVSGFALKFPTGILDGQRIDLLLKRFTLPIVTVRDFDDLNIPYRAVATDITTGEAVVIDHGDMALAMRASMSLPAIFAPREIENRLLVDGGVSVNLPIDVVRRMGADIVIAVDIGTPLHEREEIQSVLEITSQITNILTRRDTDIQIAKLTDEDVFIQPDLGDITTASFDRAAEAIPIGTAAAEAAIEKLERLSVSVRDYNFLMNRPERQVAPPTIDEVRIINQSRLDDDVVVSKITVETGGPLDVDRLEKDLDRIYGLEIFESVYYDITNESDRTVLTVTARENSWGPNYLQFGAAVFDDFEGPNFNLGVAYSRTAINRLNGEWRTHFQIGQEPGVLTELYQPLDSGLRNFVHLQALFIEQADNVFDADGNKLSELGLRRYGVGLAAGRELGTWGEIRAGVLREAGETNIQVGDPRALDVDYNTGETFLQLFVDELDNVNFPTSGGDLRIRLTAGLEELGSDSNYKQGTVTGSIVHTVGQTTGRLGAFFATTQNDDSPYPSMFRLGGFTQLSGLQQNELKGQHAALLSGIFYRRIGRFELLPFYAGLSVEYGNVFQDKDAIKLDRGIIAGSIFLGLDTILGPVHLAYGLAEDERGNFYFMLGQSLNYRSMEFRKMN